MSGRLKSPSPSFAAVEFSDGRKEPVSGSVNVGGKLGDLLPEFVQGFGPCPQGIYVSCRYCYDIMMLGRVHGTPPRDLSWEKESMGVYVFKLWVGWPISAEDVIDKH
jgi:hypothetical protein